MYLGPGQARTIINSPAEKETGDSIENGISRSVSLSGGWKSRSRQKEGEKYRHATPRPISRKSINPTEQQQPIVM
jgi:hypothetical protein